jgi:hypothetical protein
MGLHSLSSPNSIGALNSEGLIIENRGSTVFCRQKMHGTRDGSSRYAQVKGGSFPRTCSLAKDETRGASQPTKKQFRTAGIPNI